jgi:hypothetical protein
MSKLIRVPFAENLQYLNQEGNVKAYNSFLEYMMRGGKITNDYLAGDIVQVNIVGELVQVDIKDNSAVCMFYDDDFAEKVIENKMNLGCKSWSHQSRIILVTIGYYREEIDRKVYKDCYVKLKGDK